MNPKGFMRLARQYCNRSPIKATVTDVFRGASSRMGREPRRAWSPNHRGALGGYAKPGVVETLPPGFSAFEDAKRCVQPFTTILMANGLERTV